MIILRVYSLSIGPRGQVIDGIHLHAVLSHLEMEMGTETPSGVARPADGLAAGDLLAHHHVDGVQMRVHRSQAAGMLNDHHVAVAAVVAAG